MANFGKDVLNRLLDKFENSVLSKQGSTKNIKIQLTLKDKELQSYIVYDSYRYREENDIILKEYENLGFICVERETNGDFISLFLNTNQVNNLYSYLNRKNPRDDVVYFSKKISTLRYNNFLDDFILFCKNWTNEKYSLPKTYFDTIEQFENITKAINQMLYLENEQKSRDFSIKTFGDSKYFDKIKNKIAKVIFDFAPSCAVETFSTETIDEILAEYNIVKNSSYAMLRGNLILKINNQVIDLNDFKFEFLLSDEMIEKTNIQTINAIKLITVENLTTFYAVQDPTAIVLYLGGFHNHTKRRLIEIIRNFTDYLSYFHFGDIDAGGIYILKHLREKTNINFIPMNMDIKTLEENKKFCKKLTENDKKRLNKLKDTEFALLIDYMLTNDCKLEQESLD